MRDVDLRRSPKERWGTQTFCRLMPLVMIVFAYSSLDVIIHLYNMISQGEKDQAKEGTYKDGSV